MKVVRLVDEMTGICYDDEQRVVILTDKGEGSFSFGTDLSQAGLRDHEGPRTLSSLEPVSRLDRPVIAAINGEAVGQELEWILACHKRIASGMSRFV